MNYTIGNITYTIIYRPVKTGDRVLDKNSDTVFTATITDADDLGWVVIYSFQH